MGYKNSTAKLLLSQKNFLKNGKLLDVGCGEKIYKSIFNNNEYIGIDVKVSGRKKEAKLPNIYFMEKIYLLKIIISISLYALKS